LIQYLVLIGLFIITAKTLRSQRTDFFFVFRCPQSNRLSITQGKEGGKQKLASFKDKEITTCISI
jgi:hypothetical protein